MEDKDLYAALGVPKDASEDDIRTAYRKLAREHHPDVNPNDPAAEERFKEVSFANGVLSDEEKRKRYDEFGMAGLSDGFDEGAAREYQQWSRGAHRSPHFESYTSDVDLEDLLSGFFAGARQAAGPMRGADAEGILPVDFLDAARASEVPANFQGRPAMRVRIPPGAREGTRIRLQGKGGPGSEGGPAGDLYLTLQIKPHPFFTREADDLFVDLPVTIPELIRGASVDVPTPDGKVSMQIPPGSQNGRKLRLRGRGAIRSGAGGKGDLYVRLTAVLPETDDPRLEELAKELDDLYAGDNVRRNFGVDS